jgi:hypothetical protein
VPGGRAGHPPVRTGPRGLASVLAAAWAVIAHTRHPATDLARCGSTLREFARGQGLTAADVLQLIADAPLEEREAVRHLFTSTGQSPRRSAAAAGLARLEDLLDVDLGSSMMGGKGRMVGRHLGDLVGLVVAGLCAYIVIGGLVEGDSLLLGETAGPIGLILFALLVAVLGLYEALHTSATQLKMADLGAVADRYPRAARLHRQFRTDAGLSRFLAGRQAVVILTVFFCSPLASFPSLHHWPFTELPLPGVLHALVAVGIPGALCVYWLGQLFPQFLATRHAVQLTNSRVVGAAFRGAFALESLGLARPGFWLASLDRRSSNPIPSSPALRWQQAAREVDGYGIVGIVREWRVATTASRLQAATTMRVHQRLPLVLDASMLLPGVPAELVLEAKATRGSAPLALQATEHREEVLPAGDRRFHKVMVPMVGSLVDGDALRVSMSATYPTRVGHDLVIIDRPVRFALFRVIAETTPAVVPPAVLRTYRIGADLGDCVEVGLPMVVEPEVDADHGASINVVVTFPAPGTLLTLDWEVRP